MNPLRHNVKQALISLDQNLYCFGGVIHALLSELFILLGLKKYIESYWDFNFEVYADDTFSATCWQKRTANPFWKYMHKFVDWLFLKLFNEKDHCELSYIKEITGGHHRKTV